MAKRVLLIASACITLLGCTEPTPENMCHGSIYRDEVFCLRPMVDSLRFETKILKLQLKNEQDIQRQYEQLYNNCLSGDK